MLPAKKLEDAIKSASSKKRKRLAVFVYANKYYREVDHGYITHFIKNNYRFYDTKTADTIDFYWIGYGDYNSGQKEQDIDVTKKDPQDVGFIHFEPETFNEELKKIQTILKKNNEDKDKLNSKLFSKEIDDSGLFFSHH